MKAFTTHLLAALVVLFFISPASGIVIIDQTPPDNLAFGHSDFDPSLVPPVPGHYGDQFTLTATQTLTTVQWYGIYYLGNTPQVDDFTIRFHAFNNDNPGEPDINPVSMGEFTAGSAVNRTDTGVDPYGTHDLYYYSYTLSTPLTLGPGEYLVSIINDTTLDPDDTWWWSTYQENAGYQPPPALSYYRNADGLVWDWNHSELAFRILAADGMNGNGNGVPEGGATALLLAAGLGGLVLFKRAGHRASA